MLLQLFLCCIFALMFKHYSDEVYLNTISENQAKRKYIFWMSILLILQSGLRNVAVGSDTFGYYISYLKVSEDSWADIFNRFDETYVEGEGKDPGYSVFCKSLSILGIDYRFFLLFVATLFFCSLGLMMSKFCFQLKDVFLGSLIYQVLFYGFFSVTGTRQTIAVAILLLGCRFFLLNRKLIPYVLMCILAAAIHKSALIYIPFYFVTAIRNPVRLIKYILIAIPFLFIFLRPFALFLTSFAITESYSNFSESTYETQGAQMYFAFMLIIALVLIWGKDYIRTDDRISDIKILAFALGLFFLPLSWIDPSFVRVAMYFSIFVIFLFGDVLEIFCEKFPISQSSIYMVTFMIFSIILIKHSTNYNFYWNQMELPSNYEFSTETKGI